MHLHIKTYATVMSVNQLISTKLVGGHQKARLDSKGVNKHSLSKNRHLESLVNSLASSREAN